MNTTLVQNQTPVLQHHAQSLGTVSLVPYREILGVPVSRLSMAGILNEVDRAITERRSIRITAINASKLYLARRDARLRDILLLSDINIPEYAIIWGARKLKKDLVEHVGGIMLMRKLLEAGARKGYRFYFLGAQHEIVSQMVAKLEQDLPGIQIAGYRDGYFKENDEEALVQDIRATHADVLLVAMGSPRQEFLIDRHLDRLDVRVAMGVGGSFDVIAGLRKEAPAKWRRGGEWIYRLAQDPLNAKYWQRYLTTNPWFVSQIYREKYGPAVSRVIGKRNRRPALIVGAPQKMSEFIQAANGTLESRLNIVGLLPIGDQPAPPSNGHQVFAPEARLDNLLLEHRIQEVILTPDAGCLEQSNAILKSCDDRGIATKLILPIPLEPARNGNSPEYLHALAEDAAAEEIISSWALMVKRGVDVIGAIIGLMLLSPLLLVIAALVKLTSKGPIFYRWRVLGMHRKPIVSYKFRTMVQNADELKQKLLEQNEMNGCVFKMKNDPRVTAVGRLLRKYSLDELPQLWSVLKGDLSLVGPRPPLVSEGESFDDWHWRKLAVKPGLTCLWQTRGRNQICDFDQWVRLDLEYIDNWSLWLDAKILLKTIPAILQGTGM